MYKVLKKYSFVANVPNKNVIPTLVNSILEKYQMLT